MRVRPGYRVLPGHFTDKYCDRLLAAGETTEVYDTILMKSETRRARDSTIGWIARDKESERLLAPIDRCVAAVNKKFWKFELTAAENIQFTKYAPGQHYGWHIDQFEEAFPEKSKWPGLIRKLTISINLTEGAEYAGGDFEIEHPVAPPNYEKRNIVPLKAARKRGSVVIFPSFLYHRVTPVSEGTRTVLVSWFLGPPYA